MKLDSKHYKTVDKIHVMHCFVVRCSVLKHVAVLWGRAAGQPNETLQQTLQTKPNETLQQTLQTRR